MKKITPNKDNINLFKKIYKKYEKNKQTIAIEDAKTYEKKSKDEKKYKEKQVKKLQYTRKHHHIHTHSNTLIQSYTHTFCVRRREG